jgi:acyl-CoA reductase-like NAD-dependent aldehyde dehydrogenase
MSFNGILVLFLFSKTTAHSATPENDYFVRLTIFKNVATTATIAQAEIFKPVVVVIRVKNFDEALQTDKSRAKIT